MLLRGNANKVYLRGHNWVHFAHQTLCTVTLNSNFAILQTQFSIGVKELFEPIVLQKRRQQVFALCKGCSTIRPNTFRPITFRPMSFCPKTICPTIFSPHDFCPYTNLSCMIYVQKYFVHNVLGYKYLVQNRFSPKAFCLNTFSPCPLLSTQF